MRVRFDRSLAARLPCRSPRARWCARAAATLAVGLAAVGSHAAPVTGELQLAGVFNLSSAGLDFSPTGGGTGSFFVLAGTGTFASLVGTMGTVLDVAPGVAVNSNLLSFAAAPGVHFDSTALLPASFDSALCFSPAAAGQTCSPPGSAVNLVNLSANASTLSIAGTGVFVSALGETTPYVGVLTTQFANLSYQQLLATVAGGGTVTASYSVTLAPVPEPASWALGLAGLAVVAGLARRRARR